MRWDNLTLSDESAQTALFGAGDVITRTFDTPEWDDLLRGAGPFGPEQGTGRLQDAVRVDRQPLPGMQPCVPKTYQRSISTRVAELTRRYGVGAAPPGQARRGPVRSIASASDSTARPSQAAAALTSPERADQLILL
ncbi:MAG: hypothetical protein ACRDRA_19245 [Pseudonocardiaceae bacterium]